ncbi:MAG: hypothetical protein VB071_06835 [Lawsonibacter sp.]|nr:hypothetical protein [Lawsonibacter sp.]
MLKQETEKSYELKNGGTMFVVESVCREEERTDMLDALIALMKRDIEELGGK